MLLSKITESVREFIKRNDGASGIEYALVAGMVAIALVAFVPTISAGVSAIFTTIQNALDGV